jgi:hypothetical protein
MVRTDVVYGNSKLNHESSLLKTPRPSFIHRQPSHLLTSFHLRLSLSYIPRPGPSIIRFLPLLLVGKPYLFTRWQASLCFSSLPQFTHFTCRKASLSSCWQAYIHVDKLLRSIRQLLLPSTCLPLLSRAHHPRQPTGKPERMPLFINKRLSFHSQAPQSLHREASLCT